MQEEKLRVLVEEFKASGVRAPRRIANALPGGFSVAAIKKSMSRLGLSAGGRGHDALALPDDDDDDASGADPGSDGGGGGANDSDAAGSVGGASAEARPERRSGEKAGRVSNAGGGGAAGGEAKKRRRANKSAERAMAAKAARAAAQVQGGENDWLADSSDEGGSDAAPGERSAVAPADATPATARPRRHALEDSDDEADAGAAGGGAAVAARGAARVTTPSQRALEDSDIDVDDFDAAAPPAPREKAAKRPASRGAPKGRGARQAVKRGAQNAKGNPKKTVMVEEPLAVALVGVAEAVGVPVADVVALVQDMLGGIALVEMHDGAEQVRAGSIVSAAPASCFPAIHLARPGRALTADQSMLITLLHACSQRAHGVLCHAGCAVCQHASRGGAARARGSQHAAGPAGLRGSGRGGVWPGRVATCYA